MGSNYQVQSGDSYWDIAKQLWGGDDATINENRKKLQALNDYQALFAGNNLVTGMLDEPRQGSMPDPRGGIGDMGAPRQGSMPDPRGQWGQGVQPESMTDPRGGIGNMGGPVSSSMTDPRGQFGGPVQEPQIEPGGYNIMHLAPHLKPNQQSAPTSFSGPNTMSQMAPPRVSSMPDPFQSPMKMASGAPNMGMLAALIERARGR